MTVALLLSLAVSALAWAGWHTAHLRMLPDFDLYTAGGIGLFPSPLGRLLGATGLLVPVSVLAAGVCIYALWLLRRRILPAALFACSPAVLYLCYAGVDSVGLALLLLGLASSSARARAGLLTLAALTHLSVAPFALLYLPRATWRARLLLGTLAGLFVCVLMLTPYSGVVYGWIHPATIDAVGRGVAAALLLAAPALVLTRPTALFKVALTIGALECAAMHHVQVRYFLPAIALAGVGELRPRWQALSARLRPTAVRPGLDASLMPNCAPNAERPPVTATAPDTRREAPRRGLSRA